MKRLVYPTRPVSNALCRRDIVPAHHGPTTTPFVGRPPAAPLIRGTLCDVKPADRTERHAFVCASPCLPTRNRPLTSSKTRQGTIRQSCTSAQPKAIRHDAPQCSSSAHVQRLREERGPDKSWIVVLCRSYIITDVVATPRVGTACTLSAPQHGVSSVDGCADAGSAKA
ncbi:hypothetical protein IE81DRAFT_58099 [Ceraceosorus guamensis]|uniref:Uncharacterized protein n=1 Tax=Ceraceosorus guamensis TaxID=1522189 RepID=A0A316VRF3_9BASI|nr:hypothetical protein IE81DRAFT_58099 [Ceraceosorus guamensis]PWN38983.1 hypothetical protein IE81DRAFT_58099 [Ceraceosorus guamensis]